MDTTSGMFRDILAPSSNSKGDYQTINMVRDDVSVSSQKIHEPRPKGRAIGGIDYGLDFADKASDGPGGAVQPPGGAPGGTEVAPQYPQSNGRSTYGQSGHGQPTIKMQSNRSHGGPSNSGPSHGGQSHGGPSHGTTDLRNDLPGFGQQGQQWQGQPTQNLLNANMFEGQGSEAMSDMGSMEEEEPLTYEEVQQRKEEGLAQLRRLEAQGYVGARKFSHTSKLDDIEDAVEKLSDQKGVDNSIKFQRKCLVGFCGAIEMLNKAYPVFDIHLNGWAEAVYENISQYDDVFEELYYKYRDLVEVAPEIKLLGMIAGSAVMFHFSKTMFDKAGSQVPGFEQVMKADPELRRRYQDTAKRVASTQPAASGGGNPAMNMMGNLFGAFTGNPSMGNMVSNMMQSNQPAQQAPQQVQQQGDSRFQPQNVRQAQQQVQQPQQQVQQRTPQQALANRRRIARFSPAEEPQERHEPQARHEPQRRTKRAAMSGPDDIDVDGLLAACSTSPVDEIDLSAIDNFSDLSN